MTGSSAMTWRTRSRRTGRVSASAGPVSGKVAARRPTMSADSAANCAASRRRAPPKSVAASTAPAQTMPMPISLARLTASRNTSGLVPPVAPSSSAAMIAAV
jgi:hypothetical protein